MYIYIYIYLFYIRGRTSEYLFYEAPPGRIDTRTVRAFGFALPRAYKGLCVYTYIYIHAYLYTLCPSKRVQERKASSTVPVSSCSGSLIRVGGAAVVAAAAATTTALISIGSIPGSLSPVCLGCAD